jgi:transcriptional regulator with XRE-family HTH domain
MDRGDSLLRATRKWRRFTQMYVEHFRTTLSSVSQSYLTDLETGKRSGSREVLINLAKIYKVPEDLFVDQV